MPKNFDKAPKSQVPELPPFNFQLPQPKTFHEIVPPAPPLHQILPPAPSLAGMFFGREIKHPSKIPPGSSEQSPEK